MSEVTTDISAPSNIAKNNQPEAPGLKINEYTHDERRKVEMSYMQYENMSLEEIDSLCSKASEITERFMGVTTASPTVRPALILYSFNTIREYPTITDMDLIKELTRLHAMIRDEEEAAKDAHLPTIGIEIEVPEKKFPLGSPTYSKLAKWLNDNGIPVDKDFSDLEPTEFSLPPSYSAHVQARMLHELRKAGYVPTDYSFASLHVNLGVPHGPKLQKKNVEDLSDVLTYAFVPAARIRNFSYAEAVEIYGENDKDVIVVEKGEVSHDKRIEFRTPRVFGPKTYRMLEEAQIIGSLFTGEENKYDQLKHEFIDEVAILRKKYNLSRNAPTNDYIRAADAIQFARTQRENGQRNLIDDARHIMWKYAQTVSQSQQGKRTTPEAVAA